MERRGRGIEADVGRDDFSTRKIVERDRIGHLVDVTAFGKQAEEIGLVFGHSAGALSTDYAAVIPAGVTAFRCRRR